MANIITINKTEGYTSESLKESNLIITNEPFYPDIDLQHLREAMRIDGTVTTPRLTHAVYEAIVYVNDQLKTFKQQHQDKTLATVEASIINNESVLTFRYKRAVYCYAVANLFERYVSFDLTNDGEKKAEQYTDSIDDLKRDAQSAIRDILGELRITAVLI